MGGGPALGGFGPFEPTWRGIGLAAVWVSLTWATIDVVFGSRFFDLSLPDRVATTVALIGVTVVYSAWAIARVSRTSPDELAVDAAKPVWPFLSAARRVGMMVAVAGAASLALTPPA